MFDLKDLEERFDYYESAWQRRHQAALSSSVSSLKEKLSERKILIRSHEELLAKRNQATQAVAAKKKAGEDISTLIEEQKSLGPKVKEAEKKLKDFQDSFQSILSGLPNIPQESVPEGKTEEDNKEVKRWGEIKDYDFEVLSHDQFGEKKGWLDFKKAAEITGARFTVYKSIAAKLERALTQFMLDIHTRDHGYEEIIPPYIVNDTSLYGTGNLPKFEEDLFKLSGDQPYYLIPTAEVPLTNLHSGEILDIKDLPKYYTAFTPCFRSEAGSYGKDVKGLIRQHQFHKVELVKLVHPEESANEHEKMRENAERILELLKLPYRTMCLCTGDMGFASTKTYDLEVWLPSQKQYREISSVSNCHDFQSRRMGTRFRADEKSKPQFVHTLNGSGLAVGRTLIAVLENYQTKSGDLIIPECLRSYMGGMEKAS